MPHQLGRSDDGGPGWIRTRQDFASELSLIRERAGLTVRDVAKAVGIPDSTMGGYFSGRHLPSLRPPNMLRGILQACGVTDEGLIEEWVGALRRVRHAPGRRPSSAPVPYRGLASFQPGDVDWFFGRERLTNLLIGRLADHHRTGGLLFVIGPSGSGKSSLLRAGMIPALRAGALGIPGSGNWPLILCAPGGSPLHELATQLAVVTGTEAKATRTVLLQRPGYMTELARTSLSAVASQTSSSCNSGEDDGGRLVIVVDQFEEIFTTCSDDAERQAFITALCSASERGGHRAADDPASNGHPPGGDGAALVVLGLRADFYPHALRHPELIPALQDSQVAVGPMTTSELRRVIVEPARKAGLDTDESLVEVLLSDLDPAAAHNSSGAHGAAALPLLSHALLSTWKRAHRGRLRVEDYRATGGIQGAVARTADQVYEGLSAAQQELARRIFIRLVHVAEDTADTRRRVRRNELPLGQADAQQVLERFIDTRLVTAETDTVEIAHEALLRAWPRLRGWIDADRAGMRIHRQLTAAAQIWRDAGRDTSVLYRGALLATVSDWAADPGHRDDLNTLEREFLDTSTEHVLAEERATRRRTRRLQQLVAALAVLVLIAGLLAVFAFRQRAAATLQRDLAISRQVAIDANQLRSTDISLAMQLSLAAYQIAPTPEARSSLLDSYAGPAVTRVLGPPGVMESVAVSPGGRIMAAAGEDSTVRLWDLASPGRPVSLGRPLRGHTDTVYSVAFSPDGRTLATGSGDKTIRLWNVTHPDRVTPWDPPLTGAANTIYSVAFSPGGQILAAGSADDSIHLWTVANPRKPARLPSLTGPAGFIQSVAFSPNGHLLAAGSADGKLWLWKLANPRHPALAAPPLSDSAKKVFTVAFSPDGHTIAAGSADNTVRLWNISHPSHPSPDGPPLTGPSTWVNSVAFSPDGRTLAAASSDSKVWIWDLATRHVMLTLPHPAPVTTVTYLRDSHTVATSAADGVARIWKIPGPLMGGVKGPIFTTAFGTGNHILAVASSDNTARLWNVANPRQPVPLGPLMANDVVSGRASGAAALSPDGRTLVIGTVGGGCQVWDVRDPAHPVPESRLPGPAAVVESITFSPNGRILAVASDDKTTWLWDMTNPALPRQLGKPLTGPTNYVYSPAFSPNGRLLAVGGADKLVHIWDITDPSHPRPLGRPLAGASSYVYSVAFSPDGKILAAGSADDEIRLWDFTSPRHPSILGEPLTGPSNYIYSVAFSPDGKTLAATGGDGSIWLWNLTTPSRPQTLAALTGPSGAVYVDTFDTNRNILVTGGADGLARLWDTQTSSVERYICSVTGDRITRKEWHQYIQGLTYHPPCRD